MKKIKLTKGKYTIVDDEMFDFLNQWKWYVNSYGYATRKQWHSESKKYFTVAMHTLINETPKGFQADHINRNTLDNRKKNLRAVTHSRNQMNKGLQKNNTSGYRGVYWENKLKKWRVRLSIDKKRISFGFYEKLEEAIMSCKKIERTYSI